MFSVPQKKYISTHQGAVAVLLYTQKLNVLAVAHCGNVAILQDTDLELLHTIQSTQALVQNVAQLLVRL